MPAPQIAVVDALIAAECRSEAARALNDLTAPAFDEAQCVPLDEN